MIKIIAINILDGCKEHIKKNLQINSPYIFCKNYELFKQNDKNQFFIKKLDNGIGNDFFLYDKKHNHSMINISAIVGKNGSGKSALIDIILRLINNIAYTHIESGKANINFIKGIKAQLYFSIDDKFYLVQQDDDEIKNISLYKLISEEVKQHWKKLSNTKKILSESFFYTILMNYSLYAFNTLEYKEEWEQQENEETCWLKGLFHKNDGYQTPVVLNPMRTKGNIDINRENSLAKDRLISLFFNEKEGKNSIFTTINSNTNVNSISINPDTDGVKRKLNNLIAELGNNQTKEIISKFVERVKPKIIEAWQKKYEFKHINGRNKEYELATDYLVYKTISISHTYKDQLNRSIQSIPIKKKRPNFREYLNLSNLENKYDNKRINDLVNELYNESSHITFKLRQTLAFLVFRHFKTKNEKLSIKIDDFAKTIENHRNNKWKYIDFVPAPFFNTEIILENKINKEIFPFSKLSSGEKQLIYSASSILYHIRNLNSISGNLRRIKYKYINIILDEIELYFHPEFQRKYIDYLIRCINSINFKEIESINIIMSTHSPFILSDIPESNVLFLSEGKSQKGISETFGANIHKLYKNNFFIEGMPIGEFAKNKIEELFKKSRKIKKREPELYNEIRLVGEQLLRSQLLKLYNQNSSDDLNQKVNELEKEIKVLREKVNDKNTDK